MRKIINEALRRRVGLERLYPLEVRHGLKAEGIPCAGFYDGENRKIVIDAIYEDREKAAISIYLHEVGHLIAHKYKLDDAPDAAAHNQYFAVLVATMYRRANMLDSMKIYDFADSSGGARFFNPAEAMLSDEVLVDRFRYVLCRSSELAKSRLSIEKVAQLLFKEDALPHWITGKFPVSRSIYWPDIGLGAAGGAAGVVALGVAIALLLR